jgi:hypothetical protein
MPPTTNVANHRTAAMGALGVTACSSCVSHPRLALPMRGTLRQFRRRAQREILRQFRAPRPERCLLLPSRRAAYADQRPCRFVRAGRFTQRPSRVPGGLETRRHPGGIGQRRATQQGRDCRMPRIESYGTQLCAEPTRVWGQAEGRRSRARPFDRCVPTSARRGASLALAGVADGHLSRTRTG